MIRQRRMDIDEQERAFETIDRNARIMSRLVEDVLERSRIETGMLRLDRRQISLGAIVRAAIEQTRPRLESQGLHCVVNLPVEDCVVLADSERLQQVFTNLLANAMKFTPGGGRISIEHDQECDGRDGDRIRYRLRDCAGTPSSCLRSISPGARKTCTNPPTAWVSDCRSFTALSKDTAAQSV